MGLREVRPVRRLYSTFAGGWPGIGLVLMRLALGIALIDSAVLTLQSNPPIAVAIVSSVLVGAAILLAVGLCTPLVGALSALIELRQLIAVPADRLLSLLVATIGAALAMLGPGLWSIDARLFGWKRLEPSTRKGVALRP